MAAHDGASSSSSSSVSSFTHDVFLSFRGPDTGNSFTAFLHKHLEKEGVEVYIDREDLRPGEEIKSALFKAIQGSKISIPVFSKGYANSRWCLDELVEIVRCHRDNGQIILPIFLDVDPGDVRHQIGCFQISFEKHKDRFDEQTINSWKEALKEVAAISGYDLGQVTGNESKLVDVIVGRVLSESSGKRLDDVKNPVGLNARVNEVEDRLCIGSNDVQFVGICGTSGIGKTTIAKTLYNRIFKSFRRSCFLANVKGEEASGPNGLVNLQEQLISSISKWKVDGKIGNVHRGRQLIIEKLQGENVLLILDDVDSSSQLDALAVEFKWFGPASKIIITSRDKHILELAKVDEDKIYCPTELDEEQSLQLFSLHAFSSDRPPEEYLQLSCDVIHLAGGLPLTLEVLGSSLFGTREKEVWQSMAQELKIIPHEDVHKKLRISYDSLNDHEKSVFLDAACYFVGKRKEIMISIWHACDFNPISAIKKLTQRSLLKFITTDYGSGVIYNELWMHDQIQAMGRRIVYEESPKEPSKRSRIWSDEEILDAIEEPEEAEMLEVIYMGDESDDRDYCETHKPLPCRRNFAMMSKLRVLNVYRRIQSERGFPHLPRNLRWFRWNDLIVPTNFHHRKLVHMDLSGSHIGEAWTSKPQNENQLFQKLKVLCLQECDASRQSLDFSWFPYLETLNLQKCENFLKLHKSIGDLQSLVELHLSFTKIKELPNSIWGLSSLKVLDLCGCSSLKNLPESIGDLESLVRLDLGGAGIKEIPSNICKLSCLEVLILTGCRSLKNLPKSIGDLKSLVELNLEELEIEIPSSIFKLSSLTRLNLNYCVSLKKLPNDVWLPEKLEELEAAYCHTLAELPIPWGRMRCLRIIDLTGSRIFLPRDNDSSTILLPSLVSLSIGNDIESSLPPWISGLPRLQHLLLDRYMWLESLPDLPSTLTSLTVTNCPSLQTLPDLSSLSHLTFLHLHGCEELEEIRGFEGIVESLEDLKVSCCKYLEGNPRWKMHGQGTLLVDEMPQGFDNFLVEERSQGIDIYSSNVNEGIYKGLILCVVFKCPSNQEDLRKGQLADITLSLEVSIRRRKHGWFNEVHHSVKIEDVKYTSERDIIYVHRFKGFDWFGIPLDAGIDSVKVWHVRVGISTPTWGMFFDCKVKFWKVFLEGTASEQQQQITNQEAESSTTTTTIARRMVADFFNWSNDDESIDEINDESSDEMNYESSDEMTDSHNDPIQADDERTDEMIDSHNDPIQADDERSEERIPIMLRCWAWICP